MARQVLAKEEARPTKARVKTADIKQIEFSTASGGLTFVVAVRCFLFPGHSENGRRNDASVAANFAALNELRHATKVTLWVRPAGDDEQTTLVTSISFEYDSLK